MLGDLTRYYCVAVAVLCNPPDPETSSHVPMLLALV